jgi:hypothetical protein
MSKVDGAVDATAPASFDNIVPPLDNDTYLWA